MTILLGNYSAEELETLCEVNYSVDAEKADQASIKAANWAEAEKKSIALSLIPVFKKGINTARDNWKVAKYQQIANVNVETPDSIVSTKTVIWWHGLANAVRLFIIRAFRPILALGLTMLPRLFAL